MGAIKARRQGNSIMITIPSVLGVKEGDEFYFIKKDNGAIILIPKERDHFEGVAEGEYYFPELDAEYLPSEGELDGI